jgi:hypothetical protein
LEFGVWGLGFGVFGFRVWGLEFEVRFLKSLVRGLGSGCGVWGFGIWGLGLRV